jgi:hypothetical protein
MTEINSMSLVVRLSPELILLVTFYEDDIFHFLAFS